MLYESMMREGAYHIANNYLYCRSRCLGIQGRGASPKKRVIRVLNDAPVIRNVAMYLRTKWKSRSWIELMSLLRTIQEVLCEISRDNSSNGQHIWSGDGTNLEEEEEEEGLRNLWRSRRYNILLLVSIYLHECLLDALERAHGENSTLSHITWFSAKMHHFYIDD